MKTYIGSKIIQAIPMDEISFCGEQEKPIKENQETRPGYKVIYPGNYISWSPEEVFENAYREVTEAEKKLI